MRNLNEEVNKIKHLFNFKKGNVISESTKLEDVAVGQSVIKNSEYDESTNELSFKYYNDVNYVNVDGMSHKFNSTPNVIVPSGKDILGRFINQLTSTILLVTLKVTEIGGEDYGEGSKEMKRFKINDESDITLSLDKEGSTEEIISSPQIETFEKNMEKFKDNFWFVLSDDLD